MAAYRFVMEKDSGSWNSKYSGYGLINMVIFLAELHELERVGKVLGVDLNYNEKRKYEYRKANDYKGRFPGITIYLIKFFIVLWYKNKKELIIPLRRRMNI